MKPNPSFKLWKVAVTLGLPVAVAATATAQDAPAAQDVPLAQGLPLAQDLPSGPLPPLAVPSVPRPPEVPSGLGDARNLAAASAPVLGLEEAIAQTLRNDPQRAVARAALAAAQARIGTARSTGGPQVSLNGNINA